MILFDLAMIVGILAVMAFGFLGPILVGVWILRPLDQAAKRFQRPTRFSILDFFGLVFLVQMPMALIHGLVPRREAGIYWTFMVLGWLISTAVWASAVKTFSNAGIERVWTRAVLVFFALPCAFFAPFAIVVLCVVIANLNAFENAPLLVGVIVLLAVGIVVSGILTRRIANPLLKLRGNPFGHAGEVEAAAGGELAMGPGGADYVRDELAKREAQSRSSVEHLFVDRSDPASEQHDSNEPPLA